MPENRQELADKIVGRLARRHSTATVLFHHAAAERLELGPTDHKCLDLLLERGSASGTELAEATGLTTGAITGVVARLERAGYLHRQPDPRDGRRQSLQPVLKRVKGLHETFGPIREEMAELLEGFDVRQLAAIAGFLEGATALAYRSIPKLRAASRPGGARRAVQ